MILNISGRTDIVVFYSEWFMNRFKEGFVDVRNSLYTNQVSRIYFCYDGSYLLFRKLIYIKLWLLWVMVLKYQLVI